HTRFSRDWSSDVCSSDLTPAMVSITGSVRAGSEVAASAARDLKRVHLELGGKAPVVVFADADIPAAAEAIAGAGYYNAGQDCTAATRVIVQRGAEEEFTAALAEAARGTRTGRRDEDVAYGAVNNADQLARIQGFLERLPATPGSRRAASGRAPRASSTPRPWS